MMFISLLSSKLFSVLLSGISGLAVSGAAAASAPSCRSFPGDPSWPSVAAWSAFNSSTGGKLVATTPLAAPCHDPAFNNATCAMLQSEWLYPEVHYNSSSSIMAPFYTNNSCSPFSAEDTPCTIGTYVDYAVNVSCPDDIAKTIAFATANNVRLVIRNTGHDYNGKSTGAGGLAIWTHHVKDIDFITYNSSQYTGPAIKMGAGVQGIEAYEAGQKNGYAVVGGECPTVGLAGGYTQGGGHSALASKFGLAADQALEWEVVTGNGTLLTANRDQNADLYWALSGGGGGTYGVVWSLTSKAHPDFKTAGANVTFTSDGISKDTYYEAVGAFHASLPAIVDAGAMSVWSFNNESFSIWPLTGPDLTADQLKDLLKPLTDTLNSLAIKYTMVARDFSTYLDEFHAMQAPIQVGVSQYGGWLLPRSAIQQNNDGVTAALRNITEHDPSVQFTGVGVNVSPKVAGNPYNAVLPAWRDALIDSVITTPWNFTAPTAEMVANQHKMTEVYIPQLTALAPKSGCYLNEGDFRQPNWQTVFYGSNYQKLRAIKAKYDPQDVFYAVTAVGADEWTVGADGRLCKA